tara:strand:- start:255 stop:920 length:666 start_codon:yes stop_codon:yes gene_type:complete
MINKENPSQEYKDLVESYKVLHKGEGKFQGHSLLPCIPYIHKAIIKNNCKTLLDYGCGKALPYNNKRYKELKLVKPIQDLWELNSYSLYDPGYEEYSKIPTGKYDMVICTDVLEHIPEQDLEWVLKKIFNYATKAVYLNISCQPAIKHFQEGKFKGRNVHVSVFNEKWWIEKIGPIWSTDTSIKTYLKLDTKEDSLSLCFKRKGESDGNNSTDRTSNKTAG